MAYIYFALFSFLFCHNFYLNSAEKKLSDSNKPAPKRLYGHQRNDPRDDLYIAPKNYSNEPKKRHSLSGPIKTIDRDNDLYPKSYSDSSVNQSKSSKKTLGLSPFNKTRSKKNSDTTTPANSIIEKPENIFLTGIRNNEIALVKSYLKNPYLPIGEIVDNWGNTALHIAALIENFKIIKLLLLDPRIDASKRNNNASYARDLLDKTQEKEGAPLASEKIVKYKRMLFARSTLNILVHYHAKNMHTENNIDEKNIDAIVAIIKETIDKTKEKQTSSLPKNALLPSYATNEFITLMLYYQLSLINQKK